MLRQSDGGSVPDRALKIGGDMKLRTYPYFQLITWGDYATVESWMAHLKAMGVPGAVVARSLHDDDMRQTRQYSVWRAGAEAVGDEVHCSPNSKPIKGDIIDEWLGFSDLAQGGAAC